MKITILSVFLLAILLTTAGQTFAANFVVNQFGEDSNGICDAYCSLRDAIINANNSPSDDTISFDLSAYNGVNRITLNNELVINNAGKLTIDGAGVNGLTIDGGTGTNRIFRVEGAAFLVQNLTLTGGNGEGAAIRANGGTVQLTAVNVRDNAGDGSFGAIFLSGGANHLLFSSAIYNNTGFNDCAAIYGSNAPLTVYNITVSGNSTTAAGLGTGAVCMIGSSVGNFRNATISGNTANGAGSAGGGGIFIQDTATFNLGNSIVAGNTSPNRGPDLYIFNNGTAAFRSLGGNLIGDNSGYPPAPNTTAFPTGNPNANGDKVGTAGNVINPQLAPLANNGGTTLTRALLAGSPAIDAGFNSGFTSYDQRGVIRVLDGNGDGTAIIDSGAYEFPAALIVTRSDDRNNATCAPGDCSLREAINAANTLPDTDAIKFAAGLSGQTILLTPALGQLNITSNLTIDASAAANLSISGGGEVSVFRISNESATVVMTGFRITGGRADYFRNGGSSDGGGILNRGDLTLNNMLIQGNYASNTGGGINSDSPSRSNLGNRLTINGGSISDNQTGNGGGIYGFLTPINLTNVTISGNVAGSSGGGINLIGGTLNITGGSVTGNTAIYNNGGGIVTYNYTRNPDNTVTYYDSAVTISNASITNNRSFPNYEQTLDYDGYIHGNGGGIYMEGAVFTMINSTVSGNFAQKAGGGISTRGGGGYNVTGTTLSSNSTGTGSPGFGFYGGGALFSQSGPVNITNSTVSGNRSNANDGNGGGFGGGGGISTASVLNLRNVTIANNRAPNGPGGGINTSAQPGYPGTVNMGNTIVANNSNVADNGFTYTYNPDVSGAFTSQGFNLVRTRGTSSGYIASDLPDGANPLLETLGSNGGLTQTHRLLAGSQAIDRGSNALAVNLSDNTALTSDQRGAGFARIVDGNLDGTATVDIGAFEVQTGTIQPPDLTVVKSHAGNFAQGQNGAQYTIIVTNKGASATGGTVSVTDTLPTGLTAAAISGSGWSCSLGTLTCTRSDALAVGAGYPAITLTVNVATTAPSSVINRATVSGGGEANTANNTASDAATVNQVADLTVTKSHAGNFTRGDTGKTYSITVSNNGGAATSGTVSMVDSLPAGLTATAISGNNWTCSLSTVTCTRSDALASNSSYPVITLTVNVTNDAPSSVTNMATVSGGGETNTANNTANDATVVYSAANYTISGRITNGGQGLSSVTVTVSGGAATTTNATGNYTFSNLAAGGNYTVTPSLNGYNFTPPSLTFSNLIANQTNADFATSIVSYEGDVATRPGGDGFINGSDISAVSRIIALLDAQPASGSEFQRADAAPRTTLGDGSIDVLDLVQTGRYFANLDPLTPAGGFTAAQTIAPSGTAATATVSAGSVSATRTTAAVPIGLTTNGDVEAVQFSIVYDQTKLAVPANLATAFTNRYPNTTFTFNTVTPGRISVVAHQPLDGVSVFPAGTISLFDINFTIVGTPVGTTSISFGNSPIPQRAADPNANLVTVAATAGTIAFFGQNQIVNTLADHDDGNCDTTDCTLREAVKYVNAGGNISFSVNGTITLTGGEIAIAENLTISGPAGASGITVSGNNASRIFTITGSSTSVDLSALKLIGGNGVSSVGSGNGGAIYIESAAVRLSNSTLSGNSVTGNGGAIRSNATLTVTNSTFSGNTAAVTGGAIRAGGTLNITNSTISGNDAPSGGGIHNNFAVINLNGATIAYNTAATSGGGVFVAGGTTNLLNTLVAKNSNATAPDFSGAIASGSTFNLIGDGTGMTGITNDPAIGNQVGSSAAPIDPKLNPTLALNGGTTQTHALLTDSPAIDKGSATGTDQRGVTRPVDNPSIPNAAGGNGADIGAFEIQFAASAPADLTIAKSHTGNFAQGDTGKTYSIIVTNSGGTATSGTVSVTDTLPSGLTATAISGTDWTCALGTLTCTRSDVLAVTGNYTAITLTVNVANNAPSSITNTATVSGGGETNTGNNTANDPTVIASAAAYAVAGRVTNGGEGLSGVIVSISGSAAAQTMTDTSGNYSFTNLISGGSYTITPALNGYTFVQPSITVTNLTADQTSQNFATSVVTFEGDVAARPTGDSVVDIFDLITVGNIIANLPGITPLAAGGEFQRADAAPRATKGDGAVDVQDLIQIGLLAAAREPLTPASGHITVATPPSALMKFSSVELIGLREVMKFANERSSLSSLLGTNAPAAGSATVSAENVTASMGTAIVPIQLNSNNVAGIQFTITYDPAKLSIFSLASITNRAANTSFTFNNSTPGRLGVVAVQSTAGDVFPASTKLFDLNFTVAAGAPAGSAAIEFGNTPVPIKASDPAANPATIVTTSGSVTILGPTAAGVSISGRIITPDGRGLTNARVVLTDASGNTRMIMSSSFGYYHFNDVAAGETVVITIISRRYTFAPQVVSVADNLTEVNFTAVQ